MLHVIKSWLTAPVVENIDGRTTQTAEARRRKRGTPQGGVISPLLANCYFRRFLLAWHGHGHQDELDAYAGDYAADLRRRLTQRIVRKVREFFGDARVT